MNTFQGKLLSLPLDLELNGRQVDGSLDRRLQSYLRPHLLMLDDFGIKPLHPPAPEDPYDITNERYEQGSIPLTSTRAPAEWPDLFGDPLLASTRLDHLAHLAQVLVITDASFRAQATLTPSQEVSIERNL